MPTRRASKAGFWRTTAVLTVLVLLSAPGAGATDEPGICVAETYVFHSRSLAATCEASVDWQVEPPYDGLSYSSNDEADAAEPPAVEPTATTLPIWRNVYDWPSGHGYVGWHEETSSPPSYGRAAAFGGGHGLWLWPSGGDELRYEPGDWAEWTYTAPGTTRLSTAALSFAYRNKLLAHHCIDIGFRDGDGAAVVRREWCTPAKPPGSQRGVDVLLADPAANPTSKVLYVRIRVDCGGATTCSKHIPALDPSSTGGFLRLLFAGMTLVDDDTPDVVPSQELFELSGSYIDGRRAYRLMVSATDAGAGVQRVWAERVGTSELLGAPAPCDPTHHTLELDSRICPQSFSVDASVDTTAFPEGTNVFVGKAVDPAANLDDRASWPVIIDRTPPTAAFEFTLQAYESPLGLARIGWTDGLDPVLADGTPGSGVQSSEARYSIDGEAWSEWETTNDPGVVIEVAPGSSVEVEVRSVDGVGNVSGPTGASVVVSDVGGSVFPYSSTETDPDTERSLSAADEALSIEIAQTDPAVLRLIGTRPSEARDLIPWTKPDGSRFGAQLTLAWPDPIEVTGPFPWVAWDPSGETYTEGANELRVEHVTELEVMVDLLRQRVVSINPGGDAVVTAASDAGVPAAVAAGAGAGVLSVPPEAGPPGGANLRLIRREIAPWVGNDQWWNYDFQNTSIPPHDKLRARFNVDWPVSVIFWGDVDVVTAKDMWNRGRARAFLLVASPMHARVWDRWDPGQPAEHRVPSGPVWDTDRGAYLGRFGEGECHRRHKKWHYRVYAPSSERGGSDRLYNPVLGFYVIASTHLDYNERCPDAWHGLTDSAAAKLAAQVPDHTRRVRVRFACEELADPWRVQDAITGEQRQNTLNLFNRDNRGRIGMHVYKNDGFATMVHVPSLSHSEC